MLISFSYGLVPPPQKKRKEEQKRTFTKKGLSKENTPAVSLKRREWGLGLPIHIKYQLISINIGYYMILV